MMPATYQSEFSFKQLMKDLFTKKNKQTKPLSMTFSSSAQEFAGRISTNDDELRAQRYYDYDESTDNFEQYEAPIQEDLLIRK
eukprot:EST48956.1 Hypothetical protein SS50377_10803 [Spironucleus salmonicida]